MFFTKPENCRRRKQMPACKIRFLWIGRLTTAVKKGHEGWPDAGSYGVTISRFGCPDSTLVRLCKLPPCIILWTLFYQHGLSKQIPKINFLILSFETARTLFSVHQTHTRTQPSPPTQDHLKDSAIGSWINLILVEGADLRENIALSSPASLSAR